MTTEPTADHHAETLLTLMLGNEDSGKRAAKVVMYSVRPAVYREAADYLYKNEATCDQCGNAADEILLSRAKEMEERSYGDE